MKRDLKKSLDVGSGELAAYLAGALAVMANGDLSQAMRGCHEIGKENVTSAFVTKTSPAGSPWAPRKNAGDGHPLGVLTGSMAQAATGSGTGSIEHITPRSMAFGVNLDAPRVGVPQVPWKHSLKSVLPKDTQTLFYSAVFNAGRANGQQPAREFMDLNEQGKQECGHLIADDVSAKIQAL